MCCTHRVSYFFLTARNDVPTTVTPDAVIKVDYSTAASPLALPDAWKPDIELLTNPRG
ncbi:hypothetical protein Hanom_Chr10g00899161 [Helianthus anomalus]